MRWTIAAPEIFYFLAGLWFLLLSLVSRPEPRREHLTSLALASIGVLVCLGSAGADGYLFIKAYRADVFSQAFKVMLSLGLFLVVCISGSITDIRERRLNDFYFLLFICTLAMMLLVSADHLLSIYVSLEVSSYSLYILVAMRRDRHYGMEAGIKYFLIGTFASAVMLFGMALIYSTSQTAALSEITQILPSLIDQPAFIIGLLFVLGGFFFKLAVFPFHSWAPDTYQGASNQVAAYIATASKVAAIAVILRFTAFAGQGGSYLVHVLAILSVVSMTLGNFAAIVQKDFKRLLAFSTIAHSGYVLIGILVLSPSGHAATVFYALALLVMKFTVFFVIVELAPDGRNLQIEELAGLHRRSPLLALALMVALFSLAGIPPTIGFTGKFLLFVAAIEKGFIALVIIAMINVVVSLYYYLLVIKAAYLLEPREEQAPLALSLPARSLAGILTAFIVVAGFFPYWLVQAAQAAVRALIWKP